MKLAARTDLCFSSDYKRYLERGSLITQEAKWVSVTNHDTAIETWYILNLHAT